MTTRRSLRAFLGLGAVGALMLIAACTPEQQAAVQEHLARERAAAAADKFAHALSADGLARLRHCESRGNYGAVSATGRYRGAYQFSQATWNGTAARHYPHLQGVDPARAAPFDQDRMTRALWATGGPRHWPVCSRRV
jgi:resuscitation-promoting factor RpfB